MSKDKDNKDYNNKNGVFTDEEMLAFKNMSDEDFIDYLRTFNHTYNKCPPKKLRMTQCFYCIDCMKLAIQNTKEKKVK